MKLKVFAMAMWCLAWAGTLPAQPDTISQAMLLSLSGESSRQTLVEDQKLESTVKYVLQLRLVPKETLADGSRICDLHVQRFTLATTDAKGQKKAVEYMRGKGPGPKRQWELLENANMNVVFQAGQAPRIEGYPDGLDQFIGALPLSSEGRDRARDVLCKTQMEMVAAWSVHHGLNGIKKGDRQILDEVAVKGTDVRGYTEHVVEQLGSNTATFHLVRGAKKVADVRERVEDPETRMVLRVKKTSGTATYDRRSGYVIDLDLPSESQAELSLKDDPSSVAHIRNQSRIQAARVP